MRLQLCEIEGLLASKGCESTSSSVTRAPLGARMCSVYNMEDEDEHSSNPISTILRSHSHCCQFLPTSDTNTPSKCHPTLTGTALVGVY